MVVRRRLNELGLDNATQWRYNNQNAGGTDRMNLWFLGCLIVLVNLPFGYWRANVDKLTPQWFLAIHLPVPLVIAARVFGGIGWDLVTFPVLIGAYSLGQLLGSRLLSYRRARSAAQLSSCLIMDSMRRAATLLATLLIRP